MYSAAQTPANPTSANPILANALAAPAQAIGFSQNKLVGAAATNPTSLQFGPDDRLYVAQQDGQLSAYTIVRSGPGQYTATMTETIKLIQQIPNHNDDGSLAPQQTKRR